MALHRPAALEAQTTSTDPGKGRIVSSSSRALQTTLGSVGLDEWFVNYCVIRATYHTHTQLQKELTEVGTFGQKCPLHSAVLRSPSIHRNTCNTTVVSAAYMSSTGTSVL